MFTGTGINRRDIEGVIDLGFFPSIDLEYFARVYQLTDDFEADQVKQKVLTAAGSIVKQLTSFAGVHMVQGFATLSEVPQIKIDNLGELDALFIDAVLSHAKAGLMQVTYSSIREDERADYKQQMSALNANSRRALAQLQGQNSTYSELL